MPSGKFGNDATPFLVNLHLRGHDVRADAPGACRVAGLLDDRRQRLTERRKPVPHEEARAPTEVGESFLLRHARMLSEFSE